MKPTDKFISAIPDNKILVFCTGDLEPRVDISIDPFEAVTPAIKDRLSKRELNAVGVAIKKYGSLLSLLDAIYSRSSSVTGLNRNTKKVLKDLAVALYEYRKIDKEFGSDPVTNESIQAYMYNTLHGCPYETVCVMLVDDKLRFVHGFTVEDIQFDNYRPLCDRIRKLCAKYETRLVYIARKQSQWSYYPSIRDKSVTQKIRKFLESCDILFEGCYYITDEEVLPIWIYIQKK